jgi:hypothetical protein
MPPERKLTLLAYLTLLIAIGFGIYLSANRMTDPFLFWDIAFTKIVKAQGGLVFPDKAPFSSLVLAPGRQIIMFQLINMMGIPSEEFQFFPLGTIFLAFTMFLLAYEILRSPTVASLITLYLILNLSHATALYSTFAYALGFPILLGYFILCRDFLTKRSLYVLPLLLIPFVALNLIHYTLTVWAILFAIGASITAVIQNALKKKVKSNLTPAFYLSAAFVIFFLAFNETLYQSYIPILSPELFESALQRFYSFFIFSPAETFRSPFVFSRSAQINQMSTLTLALILVPVLVGFVTDLWRIFAARAKWLSSETTVLFSWPIIFLGIVDSSIYSIRGSISTKSFSMLFPLAALAYLRGVKVKGAHFILAIVLLATSLVKIGLFYKDSYYIRGNGATVESLDVSADWMDSHIGSAEFSILADLNLYGKYLLISTDRGRVPALAVFDDEIYEMVVGQRAIGQNLLSADIVAIDKQSTQPTIGFFWNIYFPLANYLDQIRNNPNLDIVYEDSNVILARPITLEEDR